MKERGYYHLTELVGSPPGSMHSVYFCGSLKGRSLLFTPESCERFPMGPCVIQLSDVLKALSVRASIWSKTDDLSIQSLRILAVISDEIVNSPHESLHIHCPEIRDCKKLLKQF